MAEDNHKSWMDKAIALGEKGRLNAPPNPWVGCLAIQGGRVVGEGFLHGAGHAETHALEKAGSHAQGASLYITLEPCSSCVEAITQAKVETVVLALRDPDPKWQGKGVEALKKAGIKVIVGTEEKAAARSLAPYLHHMSTKTPYCWLKVHSSLDGCLAAADGSSRWISGPEARINAHHLRAESQAILIGSGTAKIDKPPLTVGEGVAPPKTPPLRVVLDAWGELPLNSPLCDAEKGPTVLYTSSAAPSHRLSKLEQKGVEVFRIASDLSGSGVDLKAVLKDLGRRGILQILVEGGARVLTNFIERDLWQRLTIYFGPKLLGKNGISFFQGEKIGTVEEAPSLHLIHRVQLGETIRADYEKGNPT